jgi:hypothetical protein
MPRVLVQAGHLAPRQSGHESQTGAPGEVELVRRIRDALVDLLRADGRFEPVPMPGRIPWGAKCDAALFLHADGASPSARGCSFGFDDRYPINKRLADLIWSEFDKIPGRPYRRNDNGTDDAHFYYGFGLVDTPGPETLVEHGFITNPDERKWMESHVHGLAKAEYTALCRYFGLAQTPGKPTFPAGAKAKTKKPVALNGAAADAAPALAQIAKGSPVGVVDLAGKDWRRVRLTGYVPVSALAGPNGADSGITPASPLVARPRATEARLEKQVLGRAHASASDAEVREIIGHYYEECTAVGLDPLLAVAQMVLETGNLGSWWSAKPRRNLAGIGVTGKPNEGLSFPSWSEAVRAHVGRLLRYALREGKENAAQQKLIAAALAYRDLPKGYWGVAPDLAGLSGTWAEDAAYASKIANIANAGITGRRLDLIPADEVGDAPLDAGEGELVLVGADPT